jgi:hypothetical protein
VQIPEEAAPELSYPCRIAGSPTVHLTLGTVDGKRGDTICGLADILIPTEADAVTCGFCREGLNRPGGNERPSD